MPRYFLEISYRGTRYSGFQIQENANTVQAEIEKAFTILQKEKISLTASSRTDSGVHALQNFFHFDTISPIRLWRAIEGEDQLRYKMNAILPEDIVIRKIFQVHEDAHCRFDAISREYKYFIYRHKEPFLRERAFYFPYKLDIDKLKQAAGIVMEYKDFTSFSKRSTQVKTFICDIMESEWIMENGCLVYHVRANRFLRGMVRALTATMLRIGRGKLSLEEFHAVVKARDCTKASFSVPSQGLFLVSVQYPATLFNEL